MFYATLDLLYVLTRTTLFTPFHRVVLATYIHLVIPLLQLRARRRAGSVRPRWFPRQSAASGSGFNAFVSDLDLGVIVSDLTSERDLSVLRGRLAAWKRWMPFLGEVEIYFAGEWERRCELEKADGGWLGFLRDLRKLGWMETALASAPTVYHRRKSRRSIAAILNRLGRPDLGAAESGNLNRLASEIETVVTRKYGAKLLGEIENLFVGAVSEFSFYLAAQIESEAVTGTETGERKNLVLERSVSLALLASIPSLRWRDEGRLDRPLQLLRRRSPELNDTFRRTVEWEGLQFGAYLRGVEEPQAWMLDCRAALQRDLVEG